MGHIKEPTGIDLFVSPMLLTENDRQIVSAIIAHYKNTGEVLIDLPKKKQTYKRKTSNTAKPLRKKRIGLAV
jgi:hypothetical protein